MKTELIKLTKSNIDKAISEAAQILNDGGLVAFPTETVYGLGGNALDKEASMKIYAAKGRPSDNPLIVHIADISALDAITQDVSDKACALAEAYWPGPLTMIMRKSDLVPYETTGGLDTVAIRMPDNEIALRLIKESSGYIAAPSANTSGRPSPTKAEHVMEDLDGRIQMILDGGAVGIGIESTIVDMSEDIPTILRPGYITPEMIEQVAGEVRMDPALMEVSGTAKPKAPGMKYRHYAPKAQMILVRGRQAETITKIQQLSSDDKASGRKVGIICTDESKDSYNADMVISLGSRDNEEEIARHLFDGLRQFDEADVDIIYSECFDAPGLGIAVMNRMLKAAGHQIIDIQT